MPYDATPSLVNEESDDGNFFGDVVGPVGAVEAMCSYGTCMSRPTALFAIGGCCTVRPCLVVAWSDIEHSVRVQTLSVAKVKCEMAARTSSKDVIVRVIRVPDLIARFNLSISGILGGIQKLDKQSSSKVCDIYCITSPTSSLVVLLIFGSGRSASSVSFTMAILYTYTYTHNAMGRERQLYLWTQTIIEKWQIFRENKSKHCIKKGAVRGVERARERYQNVPR